MVIDPITIAVATEAGAAATEAAATEAVAAGAAETGILGEAVRIAPKGLGESNGMPTFSPSGSTMFFDEVKMPEGLQNPSISPKGDFLKKITAEGASGEAGSEGLTQGEGLDAKTERSDEISRSRLNIRKDGPEDTAFDLNKGMGSGKEYGESDFTKGDSGISGRKPTPDGLTVTDSGEKIYWEDKRPSECANNSWLSTYENDPFSEYRIQQAEAYRNKEISKEQAEARIIIKEHDDHMAKKGGRWNDPEGVSGEGKVKCGIRLPSDQTGRINAILEELEKTGRNPIKIEKDGVTSIIYDYRP